MLSSSSRLSVFEVSGMTCGSCAGRIDRALRALEGVHDAQVSHASGRAAVRHDPKVIDASALADAIGAAGYAVVGAATETAAPPDEAERPVSSCGCCVR